MAFLETQQQMLSAVAAAYFVVCLAMKEDTEQNRCTAEAYLGAVREGVPRVQPVSVGLFAGVLEYEKLPWPLRLMVKAMKQPEGDSRDWEAIRQWAMSLRSAFSDV